MPNWVKVDGNKRLRGSPITPISHFFLDAHKATEDIWVSKTLIDGYIWDEGMWDAFQGAFITNTQYSRDLVVDIGANIGLFSLLAANMGKRVIAVEPLGKQVDRMMRSVERNHFGHLIRIYQNALSFTYDTVSVQVSSSDNQGSAHVVGSASGQGNYGIDFVETVRLDDIVREDVKVLKLDVESFEGHVINGALSLLCNYVVEYVFMEVAGFRSRTDCSYHKLVDFMFELGYTLHHIMPAPHIIGPSLQADSVTMQDVTFKKTDPSASPVELLDPPICRPVKSCKL